MPFLKQRSSLLPQWMGPSDGKPKMTWGTAIKWHFYHLMFFTSVVTGFVMTGYYFAAGNVLYGGLALVIVGASYGSSWYFVVKRVTKEAEDAPETWGFGEDGEDFFVFDKVVPWKGEFDEGFYGQPILANAILYGPFGIMALDILLGVRSMYGGELPFDENYYSELLAFFRWYDSVRITHEALFHAAPMCCLHALAIVTEKVTPGMFPPISMPIVLGALAISAFQVLNRIILVLARAGVSIDTYFKAMDKGLPIYEIVMNSIAVVDLDWLPMDEDMDVLANVLSSNRSVVLLKVPEQMHDLKLNAKDAYVDLSFQGLVNTHMKLVGAFVKRNKYVKTINLKGNRIQKWGTPALAAALPYNRTLEKICLEQNPVDDEALVCLAAPIARRANKSLKYITLYGNEVPLQPFATERDMVLVKVPMGDLDCVLVRDIVKGNRRLTSLSLINCELTDKGITHLCNGFENSTQLTTINLDNNRIADDGAKALCRVLTKNRKVRVLNMPSNWVKDIGGIAFAHMLEHNSSLTELNLSTNRLTDKSVVDIGEALADEDTGNVTLRKLDLSGEESLTGQGAQSLFSALETNDTLEELILDRNQITNSCIQALVRALSTNTTLRKLTLSENKFSDAGVAELVTRGLRSNTGLDYFDIRCGAPRGRGVTVPLLDKSLPHRRFNAVQQWTREQMVAAWGGRSQDIYY